MQNKKSFTEEQVKIARIAKAMAHPVRVAILQMLIEQKSCFHGDMSEVIPVAKSTLSQHLRELKEAGLIQGTITLPTIKYCISKENWTVAVALLEAFFAKESETEYCEI